MDISEFLASMQSNPTDRALARGTTASTAIPEIGGDDDEGSWYSDLPASGNVEDRRIMDEGFVPKQSFEHGGYVEDDLAPEEVTAPVTPAIPEQMGEPMDDTVPEAEGDAGAEGVGTRTGRVGSRALWPEQPRQSDWRVDAMEGINAGINYGMNLHGVNRPTDPDGTHEEDVRKYLSGDGNVPPDQMEKLLQASGTDDGDEGSRWQKAIGSVYRFYKDRYGGESQQANLDDPASKAVWGVLQYARKAFNASAGFASVAMDNGNMESAARAAQMALDRIPDGLNVAVKWLGDQVAGLENPLGGVIDRWRGVNDPQGPENPRVQVTDNVQVGPGQNGRFQTVITDPESGRTVFDAQLTPDQLKHVMAEGFDRALARGTVTQLGRASEMTEGFQSIRGTARAPANPAEAGYDPRIEQTPQSGGQQPQQPQRPQRPFVSQPGLPPDMDTRNMSVGEISRLRREHAMAQARDTRGPAERIRADANVQREQIRGESNVQREQIRQTGLNNRLANAPGQEMANLRAAATRAAQDARVFITDFQARNSGRSPPQQQIDQYLRERTQFWQQRMARDQAGQGGQQPQAPQGGGQQPQAPQPQGGGAAPRQGEVRRGYRFMGGNPADRNNWQRVQ